LATSVAPGEVVESKYRVDAAIDGAVDAFAASTVDGNTSVMLFKVTPTAASAIERAKGVEHMHLAKLLEVLDVGGDKYAVAERLPGLTLAERLDDIGKKEPVDAVRYSLRIADALSSLHEAGACHGSVHPRGILIQVERHAPPVLGYFPSNDTSYRSAERGNEDPPTESDDSWAAAALLHKMLLGTTPPREGYASEAELRLAGVTDAALCAAMAHALNKDTEQRSRDVRPLKRELARWFVEHAGEEPIAPGPHSSSPPPLPANQRTLGGTTTSSMPAAPSRPPSTTPKAGMRRIIPLAVGGIVVGLLGGWVFNALRPKPPVEAAPKVTSAPAAPASDKPIDLGEVPVTGESEKTVAPTDKLSSCVMGYLPQNTFGSAPDFSGFCDQSDPRAGADKLRVAIVASAPKTGGATTAMKIFARIGWYDMAAFAVVRAGCCPDAKPLELPEASKTCSSMSEALQEVGKEVVANHPAEESLKKYTAAIHCEVNVGRGQLFRKAERPAGGEDSAFLELVKSFQTP
jgi:serine/threonine protein kinase